MMQTFVSYLTTTSTNSTWSIKWQRRRRQQQQHIVLRQIAKGEKLKPAMIEELGMDVHQINPKLISVPLHPL